MSELLFLQFQSNQQQALRWFHLLDEKLSSSGDQSLESFGELKDKFPAAKLIALVPSTDCLVSTVAIPTQQRRQQIKAIPFALEEQIATDIEDMHFAIGARREDGLLSVTAVAKNKMQFWNDCLEQAGLSCSIMQPMSSLLEAPNDAWSIFKLNELFLVNQNGNCWTGAEAEVSMLLSLSIQQLADDKQPALLYWSEDDTPSWINGLGLEVSNQKLNNAEQALLNRFDRTQTNLLQGEFSSKQDWNAGWQVWRKVAVFAMVAVLLKFTMMGFDLYSLSDKNASMQTEMERQYHLIAPGARITKNLERQMRQLIKQKQGGQNQNSSFLMMLSLVGEGLSKIPGIKPTNLNYDGKKGEIRIDVLVSNLPQLDQLKSHLSNKGLLIEVGAASAQGSSYSGRLTIRSGS